MPTYDYKCSKCSIEFERFQRITDEPIRKCPECNGKVKRLIAGGTGIIFKGSGFYVTDNKKSGIASSPNKKENNIKKDAKSDTKTAVKDKKDKPSDNGK